MRSEPMPASLAGDRIRMNERRGRSIHDCSSSVRSQRGVLTVIVSRACTVFPQSAFSARSTTSRPLGSWAGTTDSTGAAIARKSASAWLITDIELLMGAARFGRHDVRSYIPTMSPVTEDKLNRE